MSSGQETMNERQPLLSGAAGQLEPHSAASPDELTIGTQQTAATSVGVGRLFLVLLIDSIPGGCVLRMGGLSLLKTEHIISDIILYFAKLYTDGVHPCRRSVGAQGTIGSCVLPDVRDGHWLVFFLPSLSFRQRPHIFFSITGWCVALGGTTALDTLGSQAFTGGQRKDVSIHLQRCIFLLWLLFIPVACLWTFVDPVLRVLGQDARLSYDVQRFLRVLIAGAPGYIAFESLKKYLQCQGLS